MLALTFVHKRWHLSPLTFVIVAVLRCWRLLPLTYICQYWRLPLLIFVTFDVFHHLSTVNVFGLPCVSIDVCHQMHVTLDVYHGGRLPPLTFVTLLTLAYVNDKYVYGCHFWRLSLLKFSGLLYVRFDVYHGLTYICQRWRLSLLTSVTINVFWYRVCQIWRL